MASYPVFLELDEAVCLVVGGGAVSQRKVARLIDCGARVVLVCPEATEELEALAAKGAIEWRRREAVGEDFEPDDGGLAPRLVFLCTDSRSTQGELSALCREKGLLVNVVDSQEEGTFTVPSVVRRDPLQVAISTSGQCPSLARRLREEMEQWLDPAFAVYAGLLGEFRRADIEAGLPEEARWERLERLMDGRLLAAIREGGEGAGREVAGVILGE